MKKIVIFILILLCFFAFGCNKENKDDTQKEEEKPVEKNDIIISFVTNCDIVKADEVLSDNSLTPLEREGYTFVGWYLDEGCKVKANKDTIQASITIYAKWEEIKLSVKVFNDTELLDVLTIKYGEKVDMNKYLLDGLKFVSCDKDYNNIKENTDLKCEFEELSNTILFIKEKEKVEVKLFNPNIVGVQLDFKGDKEAEFQNVLPKGSVKLTDNTYKFIYSNNKNITSTKTLFVLDANIEISEVNIKAYTLQENGDVVECNVEYAIYE